MRLLNTSNEQAKEFLGDIPRYSILSHTWGQEEVSLSDLLRGPDHFRGLSGYAKIAGACAVARREGFDWIWIDTCCIDKSSSAELSEAINSMFNWYKDADVCYAYLSDVLDLDLDVFAASRWFKRGWTLQELIAPAVVVFLGSTWRELGTKASLAVEIASITGIDTQVLSPQPAAMDRSWTARYYGRWTARYYPTSIRAVLDECSVAQRMSWAARRVTSRPEDQAYALMGLFGVNMPLLYGEGSKAFIRLQREIMNQSDDMSIFVW
ncbi:heterokaryon incompatibility protein-domain-containing protein, partial [Lasiosphaeria miniovina]